MEITQLEAETPLTENALDVFEGAEDVLQAQLESVPDAAFEYNGTAIPKAWLDIIAPLVQQGFASADALIQAAQRDTVPQNVESEPDDLPDFLKLDESVDNEATSALKKGLAQAWKNERQSLQAQSAQLERQTFEQTIDRMSREVSVVPPALRSQAIKMALAYRNAEGLPVENVQQLVQETNALFGLLKNAWLSEHLKSASSASRSLGGGAPASQPIGAFDWNEMEAHAEEALRVLTSR